MTDYETPKFFGHNLSDLMCEMGQSEWVETLYNAEFNPEQPERLAIQVASVLAALQKLDSFSAEDQQKILFIAQVGFQAGLESIRLKRDELREQSAELDEILKGLENL